MMMGYNYILHFINFAFNIEIMKDFLTTLIIKDDTNIGRSFSIYFYSMWWAVVTLTTVGYGDVYPITVGGKIFTSFIVLIGIGLVAVPTRFIASALTKVVVKNNQLRNPTPLPTISHMLLKSTGYVFVFR